MSPHSRALLAGLVVFGLTYGILWLSFAIKDWRVRRWNRRANRIPSDPKTRMRPRVSRKKNAPM